MIDYHLKPRQEAWRNYKFVTDTGFTEEMRRHKNQSKCSRFPVKLMYKIIKGIPLLASREELGR
jgi:hypothetical protein